ncbi:MAG TPA: type IVB secretion system protein IcmH/DotU [Noviherbaspirillum sp.]|nr:type IVB secretion system protein IcmH/DotU [Noviherbaspirillum sp.]HJV85027.1 type IVB secretion system protein IcmH/DotU [Noviherbaspirillum sp.]
MTDALIQNTISHAPSLFEDMPAHSTPAPATRSLADLMHEGFYLLLLMRNRYFPADPNQFSAQVCRLLDNFERNARRMNVAIDDIYAAKYAFCAAVDETILSSEMAIREIWEQAPLQLTLFGDQLAGENFYKELEAVRHRGQASVQTLEVFYMCLLTGFQGKYALESKEKLNYLIATLDKEITHLKGKRPQFAPHWKSPDQVKHMLRSELPLWVIGAALACLGLVTYGVLGWLLARHSNEVLGAYFDIIRLAPRIASITISLP